MSLVLQEPAAYSLLNSAGGVKLASGNGRITLDNTLDERLRLLEDRVRVRFDCSLLALI